EVEYVTASQAVGADAHARVVAHDAADVVRNDVIEDQRSDRHADHAVPGGAHWLLLDDAFDQLALGTVGVGGGGLVDAQAGRRAGLVVGGADMVESFRESGDGHYLPLSSLGAASARRFRASSRRFFRSALSGSSRSRRPRWKARAKCCFCFSARAACSLW